MDSFLRRTHFQGVNPTTLAMSPHNKKVKGYHHALFVPGWVHCVYPVFLPSPKHSHSWQRVAVINGRLDRWESQSMRPRMPLFCCQSKSGWKKSVSVLYQSAEWERSLQVSLHWMLNWTNRLSVLSRSHPIVPITMTACLELNMWVLPEWRWISNLSLLSALSAPAGLFASSKQDCWDFSPCLPRQSSFQLQRQMKMCWPFRDIILSGSSY